MGRVPALLFSDVNILKSMKLPLLMNAALRENSHLI